MSTRPTEVQKICEFVGEIAGEDMHAKRVLSVANAVTGLVHHAVLAVHAIGLGLAHVMSLDRKHTTKQVDRFLSNTRLSVWDFFGRWVPYILRGRADVVVDLDWTDFDADDHATLCLYLATERSRATPLMWVTGLKSEMKGWQRAFEEDLLSRFRQLMPREPKVTVLADRGFGDAGLYETLRDHGFQFIIRFRETIVVESAEGSVGPAKGWTPGNGRALRLPGGG